MTTIHLSTAEGRDEPHVIRNPPLLAPTARAGPPRPPVKKRDNAATGLRPRGRPHLGQGGVASLDRCRPPIAAL
jgi:hypothetical protein